MDLLDDVDVHCYLRSIFRHFPAPDTSDSHAKAVRQFLGLEPVFLVSLTLNDSRGSDSVHVFQAGEAGLRSIIRTLQDSLAQLEVIREKFPMVGKSMGGK